MGASWFAASPVAPGRRLNSSGKKRKAEDGDGGRKKLKMTDPDCRLFVGKLPLTVDARAIRPPGASPWIQTARGGGKVPVENVEKASQQDTATCRIALTYLNLPLLISRIAVSAMAPLQGRGSP